MKTKLLFTLLSSILFVSIANAQTKVWDFGNDGTNWPIDATGVSGNVVRDNLGIYMGITSTSNIGIIESSPKTFPDGYVGQNRFKLNGAGYSGSTFQVMPTQRYIYFATAGNCTVKVWFRSGGSGNRTLYVTDGTSIVGSLVGTNSTDGLYFESTYTGGATNLYIYGDQACNLYKIEVVGALGTTLNSESFQNNMSAIAYVSNSQVFLSNIINDTKVEVYSLTGQLVKSFNTSTDTNFDLNQGFYIVKLNSEAGNKSLKLLVN